VLLIKILFFFLFCLFNILFFIIVFNREKMGISISKTLYGLRYNNEKEVKVTMVGIDAAGKTTILYRLLKGETVNTIPTTGIY